MPTGKAGGKTPGTARSSTCSSGANQSTWGGVAPRSNSSRTRAVRASPALPVDGRLRKVDPGANSSAVVSAISKSGTFPPNDPWLSGQSINYYYFGYVIMTSLTVLSGVPTTRYSYYYGYYGYDREKSGSGTADLA